MPVLSSVVPLESESFSSSEDAAGDPLEAEVVQPCPRGVWMFR